MVRAALADRAIEGWGTGLGVPDLAELGVRRVSVGSSLARAAWSRFIRAAKAMADEGSFAGFEVR
jgi:2-methylisocitrate lyase-like PEP mutase family enzyme